MRLDDAVTAMLNYREGRWPPEPDGSFWTQMVRRKRPEGEKADDVADRYRAEITPVTMRGAVDPGSGRRTARFDLGPFASWARPDRPATIIFGREGHPEQITMELILGTSARLAFGGAEAHVREGGHDLPRGRSARRVRRPRPARAGARAPAAYRCAAPSPRPRPRSR